jgi:GNAT superfamily N-acetyltransferase
MRDDDVAHVVDVVNDAATAYDGIVAADALPEPYMSAGKLRDEAAAGVVLWVAEMAGDIVGVMGVQNVGDVTLVRHVYVRTALQGFGVGGMLMRDVLPTVAGRPLLVGTWRIADWAIGFYEKHGFTPVDDAEGDALLRRYWTIPDRQREESLVMRRG